MALATAGTMQEVPVSAALYGEITLKKGRVGQSNFDNYQMLRINETPQIDVHIVKSAEPPGGISRGIARHVRQRQKPLC
jgi:CO/xanthine dehydrogenase Mo-binding subunit